MLYTSTATAMAVPTSNRVLEWETTKLTDLRGQALASRRDIVLDYFKRQHEQLPLENGNKSEDHDLEYVCPYRSMHTNKDPDPDNPPRQLRVWLNRQPACAAEEMPSSIYTLVPTLPGKIFMSCRHNSCWANVWEDTLTCRRLEENSTVSGEVFVHKPSPAQMQRKMDDLEKMRKMAERGSRMKATFLEDESPCSESDIMGLSPYKFSKDYPLHPYDEALLFLGLFNPKHSIWIGEETTSLPSQVRSVQSYMDLLTRSKEQYIKEKPEDWPWPGRYYAPCSFTAQATGRKKDYVEQRLFVVCEQDGMTKKDQLRLIRAMIKDGRFPIAYVLYSGSKSYHIGLKLDTLLPQHNAMLAGLTKVQAGVVSKAQNQDKRVGGMGFCPMSLRVSQAVRFPGPTHQKTGRRQTLLYINTNLSYK